MGQIRTHKTDFTDYIISLNKQIETLPHLILQVEAKRALRGVKKEYGEEFNVGKRKKKKVKLYVKKS
jgi:hypothetical protein